MTAIEFANVIILIAGVVTAWCVSHKDRIYKKWGFAVGVSSEPFWLYTTAATGNWGIFALTLFYLAMNIRGFINHKDPDNEE